MTRIATMPDGTEIAWDEIGEGAPVLLIHGLGSSKRRWDSAREALAAAGFRAVRFDLRGHGESTPATAERPFGMAELVADLESLVDLLALERFHLVGHSLGGMLAQRFAVEHPGPVRSLVLASTTSHNGRRATAFAEAMVLFSERGFDAVLADPALRPRVDAILSEAFFGGPPPYDMLRPGLEEPDLARANAWRACVGFSAKDGLAALACPVLVTHGSADPLIPFRAGQLIHEAIPHSRFIAEEGAGHSLPTSRAASFNANLIEFLRAAPESHPS